MNLDDIFAATEDGHIDDVSESSEPAPWDPPTNVTLVPVDPAATASPAAERHSGPQQVPAVAVVPTLSLWVVFVPSVLGGAVGAFGGCFAAGVALVWALGL